MESAKLWILVAVVCVICTVAEAKQKPASAIAAEKLSHPGNAVQGRGKRDDRILQRIYMGFMMAKSVISLLLMFVSPILQVKGLLLSFINVIVNVARLVLQFKSYKEQKEQQRLSAPVVHLEAYPAVGSHEDVTSWDVYTHTKPDTEWSESYQYNKYTTEPYRGYQPKSANTGYNWNAIQDTQQTQTYVHENVANLIDITANEAQPAYYVHNVTTHLST